MAGGQNPVTSATALDGLKVIRDRVTKNSVRVSCTIEQLGAVDPRSHHRACRTGVTPLDRG
eukprot:CAMPEP_0171097650 /NCGR_PEP_ID=MMETSP0766_2-20121228/47671_1 /TAXON_ID=439317 /ORGANISM="Gambierdiscus australes, Strain CAWD 149" /LENGTH=60 /DNA_ID=CAMNT_0011556879 /DNA_START=15 /DNA_END=193 /DNA_ORIENTATION=-